ncbi:MAG TPA: hypothetical protein VM778_02900 [Gemmatimonadota bacterium]|nr:hypothetical protein [Gemmatimonadota bacterium]
MRVDPAARAIAALLLTVAALLAGAADAAAQSRSIFANPTQVSLPIPGAADFDFGYVQYQGTVQLSIDVPGTSNWAIHVHIDDPDLGFGKPVGDLLYQMAGGAGWSSATPGEQLLTSGSGDATIQVEIAMAVDWATDSPNDYAGTLVFRVIAN